MIGARYTHYPLHTGRVGWMYIVGTGSTAMTHRYIYICPPPQRTTFHSVAPPALGLRMKWYIDHADTTLYPTFYPTIDSTIYTTLYPIIYPTIDPLSIPLSPPFSPPLTASPSTSYGIGRIGFRSDCGLGLSEFDACGV